MASFELTGKRNLHYNRRHRLYGSNMLMYDIDAIEIDAKTKQPVCMFETKFGLVQEINLQDYQFQVLRNISNKLEIPLFCLVYYPMDKNGCVMAADTPHQELQHIQYLLIPVNQLAKEKIKRGVRMTEKQFVGFLYRLRGSTVDIGTNFCDTWRQANLPTVLNN